MSPLAAFLLDAPQVATSTPVSGVDTIPFSIPTDPEACHDDLNTEEVSYSPPPSPTHMSSVARFESPPLLYPIGNTPSLLDETLPSAVSSPFLAHTPAAYATTRNPQHESSSFIGLGIYHLFKQDGSVFDGMGVLSKRNEACELRFFMDESGCSSVGAADEGDLSNPEHQEDAWRRRMSLAGPSTSKLFTPYGGSAGFPPFDTLWSPNAPPLGCSSPVERRQPEITSPMPVEPEDEDVFFTRGPSSGSPFIDGSIRLARGNMVSLNWFESARNAH